jgi:hypothetical protein
MTVLIEGEPSGGNADPSEGREQADRRDADAEYKACPGDLQPSRAWSRCRQCVAAIRH